MHRRKLMTLLGGLPLMTNAQAQTTKPAFARIRPGDAGWPSAAQWRELEDKLGDRLLEVQSPLSACAGKVDDPACAAIFKGLKNPYYVRDNVALTQTSGWADAWSAKPSVRAVAARTSADVAAAVDFARRNKMRLVVKGGGHSYQGTSNAADSLLVWTRAMDDIVLHEGFVGQGCNEPPQPAVSLGAGCIWLQAYSAAAKAGRYVQGGGCMTVGVAGLIQSGGFGSFSKRFGLAAAGLIEAEVVTRRRQGGDRQCLHQSRPVLGTQGRRGRQLGSRDTAHAQDASVAAMVRRRLYRHQGEFERCVPCAHPALHRLLQG